MMIDVNERNVYCYQCEHDVHNDSSRGDIQLAQNLLEQIANQSYQESCTRNGKVLRPGGRPMFCRQESKIEEANSREADKRYTATHHHKGSLLAKIFAAWILYVSMEKKERIQISATTSDTPEPSQNVTSNQVSDSAIMPPPKRKPTLVPGITGLRNLGNTCYMNSVLQALGHLVFFRESFRGLVQSSSSPVPQTPSIESCDQTFKSCDPTMKSCDPTVESCDPTVQSTVESTKMRRSIMFNRQTTIECFDHICTKVTYHGSRKRGVSGVGLNGGEGSDFEDTGSDIVDATQGDVPLLCQELHALMRVMWSGKWAVVTPHAVLASIWKFIPSFHGYAQQDAQEFLCEILYRLQSELEHFAPDRPLPVAGSSCYHLTFPSEIIPNLFEGQLYSEVKYLTCGHTSVTTETFWDLSIDFPERYQSVGHTSRRSSNRGVVENPCDLKELLDRFTSTEKLEGKVFRCDQCSGASSDDGSSDSSVRQKRQCSSLQHAEKRLLISKAPDVLRLHLKRFRWVSYNRSQKINAHVNFDFELDLSDYCVTDILDPLGGFVSGDHMYDLVSIIMHHGTGFGSGHYSSYNWNNIAGCWVHCNDARIKYCSSDEVAQSQAYILFFMRRHGITSDTSAHVIPTTPITPFLTNNISVPCNKRRRVE
ncbi:ubiquitin carboxyl-terminal hydrolase 44-like isoform X2 [Dysidea avara]